MESIQSGTEYFTSLEIGQSLELRIICNRRKKKKNSSSEVVKTVNLTPLTSSSVLHWTMLVDAAATSATSGALRAGSRLFCVSM